MEWDLRAAAVLLEAKVFALSRSTAKGVGGFLKHYSSLKATFEHTKNTPHYPRSICHDLVALGRDLIVSQTLVYVANVTT